MTSLSLLSCSNNALKIEREKRNVTERGKGMLGERRKKKKNKKWID